MRRRIAVLAGLVALAPVVTPVVAPMLNPVLPAQAIEVCKKNHLGQVVCRGQPTHGLDPLTPFPPRSKIIPPAPTPQARIPGARTNTFGDTYPKADETTTGRPRPRICRSDGLGNLRC